VEEEGEEECEPELEPEECEPPEPWEEEPGLDPPLLWCEEGGGFECPPPELLGGGLLGSGDELVRVFVLRGGVVVAVVVFGVVTLGHDSLTLDARAGSLRVEGDTPGGRW
jgi:hypothetical protein